MRFVAVAASLAVVILFWLGHVDAHSRTESRARFAAPSPKKHVAVPPTIEVVSELTHKAQTDAPQAPLKQTWAVRFVGSDNKPATPTPVHHRVVLGEKWKTIKPADAIYKIPAERGFLKYGQHEWTIEKPHTVLRLKQLIPLTVEWIRFDTNELLGTATVGHVDKIEGSATRSLDEIRSEAFFIPSWTVNEPISCYARKAHYVWPVFPWAKVTVRVIGPDGPVAGAEIGEAGFSDTLSVEGGTLSPRSHEGLCIRARGNSDAEGKIAVQGVPLIVGEKLIIQATKGDRSGNASITLKPSGEHKLVVRLRPSETALGYWSHGHAHSDDRVPRHSATATGSVVVYVRRHSGLPGAGARIVLTNRRWHHVTRANAEGRALFEDVADGTFQVKLDEPGLLQTTVDVTVRSRQRTAVVLREHAGWQLTVRVLDHHGEPVAGAGVAATGFTKLVDGVQILGPHATDARGVVIIEPISPEAELFLNVTHGTRVGALWAKRDTPDVVVRLHKPR